MNIIEIDRLKKNYGNVSAVQDLSFSVEKGELFGFLGVNGAGKSTTINILCTLFPATEGAVSISGLRLGKEDREIRRRIGVVAQQNCLDDFLTIQENLLIRGSLYESNQTVLKKRLRFVSELLGLEEILKRPFAKLSGGQKRRCEIARALMHSPEILFLDEPTTGLDPATRQAVWSCVKALQEEQRMTVFLTTHYMEEAAAAHHIAIIDRGRLMEFGTPAQLKDAYARDQLFLIPSDWEGLQTALQKAGISFQTANGRIVIPLPHTTDAIPILNQFQPLLQSFEVLQGAMDDVFLTVTGKNLKEESA